MQQECQENDSYLQFERLQGRSFASESVDDLYHFNDRTVLGQGAYGYYFLLQYSDSKVYKVLSKSDLKFYALKSIKVMHEKEGFPITALREIKFLRAIRNQNLINIWNVVFRKKIKKGILKYKAYYVMDFMDYVFSLIIKKNFDTKVFFSTAHIRCILYQILLGLQYLHQKRIIHRDIKSSNILINNIGEVKLADFGLAKFIPLNNNHPKTPVVVTLPYRAPEILFTKGIYDFKIDIWSLGCFGIELLTSYPCFTSRNEQDHAKQMFELCGSPDEFTWPDILNVEQFQQYKPKVQHQRKLISYIRSKSPNADDDLVDLLNKMLELNPQQRSDVSQALNHVFFNGVDLKRDQLEQKKQSIKYLSSLKDFLKKSADGIQKSKFDYSQKVAKVDLEEVILAPMKKIKL